MKRIFFFIFFALCFSFEVSAYDAKIDGIYYNLQNSNKTATVTYQKKENRYINGKSSECYSSDYPEKVVIPDSITYNNNTYCVTSIGDHAFHSVTPLAYGVSCNSSLTSVTIPNSVKTINDYAFYGCGKLTSVTIPESVTSIGSLVFYGCGRLNSVTIPNSVTYIGDDAFYGCGLTSIVIPYGIKYIRNGTFFQCRNLESVTIPNSVISIGSSAFYECEKLTSVTIPEGVTSIGARAFYYCHNLTSVNIPKNIKKIEESTFHSTAISCITLPEGLEEIGSWAFYGTYLTSIVIPENVKSIGYKAFRECRQLKDVYSFSHKVPATGESCFEEVPLTDATLHIPSGSLEAYRNAKQWRDFGSIIALTSEELVPVDYIPNDVAPQIVAVYDINGRKHINIQKGLNIVKYNNGEIRKIFK